MERLIEIEVEIKQSYVLAQVYPTKRCTDNQLDELSEGKVMSKALRRFEDARSKDTPFFCTRKKMDFELDENTVVKVSGKACKGETCAP